MDSVQDGIKRFAFHHVAPRARPQGTFGVERFVVHRDDQDWQLRLLGLDYFCEFNPIGPASQAHIYDRKVKFLPPDRVECGMAAVSFRANFDVRLLAEELNHAFAKKRVVINEQNTTFVRSDPCLGFRIFLHCEEMTHWRERLLPISYRLFCRDWMANLSARPQIEVFFSGKAGAMKSAGHVLNDVVGEFGQRVP